MSKAQAKQRSNRVRLLATAATAGDDAMCQHLRQLCAPPWSQDELRELLPGPLRRRHFHLAEQFWDERVPGVRQAIKAWEDVFPDHKHPASYAVQVCQWSHEVTGLPLVAEDSFGYEDAGYLTSLLDVAVLDMDGRHLDAVVPWCLAQGLCVHETTINLALEKMMQRLPHRVPEKAWPQHLTRPGWWQDLAQNWADQHTEVPLKMLPDALHPATEQWWQGLVLARTVPVAQPSIVPRVRL